MKGREWEGIKGFLLLTDEEEEKGQGSGNRDERGWKGQRQGGDLAPRSWGDRRPCHTCSKASEECANSD